MNSGDGGTAEGRIYMFGADGQDVQVPIGMPNAFITVTDADGMLINDQELQLDTWYRVDLVYPETGRWARIKTAIKRWRNCEVCGHRKHGRFKDGTKSCRKCSHGAGAM